MVQQRKIDAYLTGTYSETEKDAFESQLIADEALFVQVETQRALRRAGLRQQVEQLFVEESQKRSLWVVSPQRIAAGLLFFGLCFGGYNAFWVKPSQPIVQVKPPDANTDSPMLGGGMQTTAAIVTTVLNEEDMVGQTIGAIIASIRNAPLDDNLLVIKKLEKERPDLVAYFQGLAYLKAEKVDDAKALLQKIANTPNHPKQATAKEILEQMQAN
jgi:hypothetical protein